MHRLGKAEIEGPNPSLGSTKENLMTMTLEEYEKLKPQLQQVFEKAFLKCEQDNPGFLRRWFKAWSEGPKE